MSITATQPALKASAGVLKCRVVYMSGASIGTTATAATVVPMGISLNFTKYPPNTAADSPAGTIAETGDAIPYVGRGQKALAYVASDVTGGTRVEASTAGGIAPVGAAGAGKWIVGWVEDSCAAGGLVWVFVDPQANQA